MTSPLSTFFSDQSRQQFFRANSSSAFFAAKERKEHKEKELLLCDLGILLRRSTWVAAPPRTGINRWESEHLNSTEENEGNEDEGENSKLSIAVFSQDVSSLPSLASGAAFVL